MAIELIAKIKQANNGTFKLLDAIDVELKDGSDLQSFLDKLPSGGTECIDVIYQGDTEPTDENIKLWIDTSEEEREYTGEIEDKVILEFREMFKYLTGKIEELQAKNIELEARIAFLEENGSSGGGGIITPPDDSSNSEILVMEDGSILIDEEGNILTFSIKSNNVETETNDTILILETKEILITENNEILKFEK